MDKTERCRFFREGKPDSCLKGSKCPYQHETNKGKRVEVGQDKAHPNHGGYPSNKFQGGNSPYPSSSSERGGHQPGQWQNDSKQKGAYIQKMIESLKKKCKRCNLFEHLVFTFCGCQVLCKNCLSQVQKCPICSEKVNKRLWIGA